MYIASFSFGPLWLSGWHFGVVKWNQVSAGSAVVTNTGWYGQEAIYIKKNAPPPPPPINEPWTGIPAAPDLPPAPASWAVRRRKTSRDQDF